MNNYFIIVMNKATGKLTMGNKLCSFGSLALLLSSENYQYNFKYEFSIVITLLLLILTATVFSICRNMSKQKMTDLNETKN